MVVPDVLVVGMKIQNHLVLTTSMEVVQNIENRLETICVDGLKEMIIQPDSKCCV